MEIVVQILKNLPAGWPRIIVFVGLGLLFFFPEFRHMLTRRRDEDERLDQLKQLLELRKLELDVAELKANNPQAENPKLDLQIGDEFSKVTLQDEPKPKAESTEMLPWFDRIKFSLAGSSVLMTFGVLALWFGGRFLGGDDVLKVISIEVGLTLICGMLASAIPSRSPWECVFRGILIPALLGAMTVAAIGNA